MLYGGYTYELENNLKNRILKWKSKELVLNLPVKDRSIILPAVYELTCCGRHPNQHV